MVGDFLWLACRLTREADSPLKCHSLAMLRQYIFPQRLNQDSATVAMENSFTWLELTWRNSALDKS